MLLEYAKRLKNTLSVRRAEKERYAAVRQFVKERGRGRLLDIGVGSDEMLRMLGGKGLDLYGVDISSADRERSIDEIALMGMASIEELPYNDGFFDCVTSVDTPPLWQDKAAAFAEILRVLRSGGQLVCAFEFDDETGAGTPPRAFRAQARKAGLVNVSVKVLREEGGYLLVGEKP